MDSSCLDSFRDIDNGIFFNFLVFKFDSLFVGEIERNSVEFVVVIVEKLLSVLLV